MKVRKGKKTVEENQRTVTLRALVDQGRQAEQLKRYLETNPYLYQVFERVKLGLFQAILSLKPDQKDAFMVLKSRIDFLYEPLACVDQDILGAERALTELETGKVPGEGGLL